MNPLDWTECQAMAVVCALLIVLALVQTWNNAGRR
jgi:hypothetical protein